MQTYPSFASGSQEGKLDMSFRKMSFIHLMSGEESLSCQEMNKMPCKYSFTILVKIFVVKKKRNGFQSGKLFQSISVQSFHTFTLVLNL